MLVNAFLGGGGWGGCFSRYLNGSFVICSD